MIKLLIILILFAAALIMIIRAIESRSIFFPMKGTPAVTPAALPHEDVFFNARDGSKLHGWYVPSRENIGFKVDSSNPITVLFLHGNAGNIGHRWDKVRIFHDLGASVFLFDYRGYGLSAGTPSEKGIHSDTDAAAALLASRGIPMASVIVYGESIGGGFATALAAKTAVGGLIVEDSFTSIPDIVRASMPFIPAFALGVRLDSLDKIKKAAAPVLIFHSEDDEIVPFEMGERLFAAAPNPKHFVRLRGGHNTAFYEDIETYRPALRDFFEFVRSGGQRQAS
ncbi:MAG: alpha/beta hydrolase [Candidatus Omnitrophica bacterium]|nr:alpha/beta hydrolase [Candidatus Omnitrophota bacterium]